MELKWRFGWDRREGGDESGQVGLEQVDGMTEKIAEVVLLIGSKGDRLARRRRRRRRRR